MNHGSLFSGIGGFDLAAQWMGWENIFQVEKDDFCQKVLTKNFPQVKRYGDIKQFDGTKYRGTIDILTGGFPCQPFSQAGNQKGTNDHRHLWPEMHRIINEVKPWWVVAENVYGLLNIEKGLVFESVCSDLENSGYQTQAYIIPACGVGAPHRRKRIWIIGQSQFPHSDRVGFHRKELNEYGDIEFSNQQIGKSRSICQGMANTYDIFNGYGFGGENDVIRAEETANEERWKSLPNSDNWHAEPSVGRVAYGIPNRVDRIKSLGNAVVPQVVFEIFKAIEACSKNAVNVK